jgi:hypothetical protein
LEGTTSARRHENFFSLSDNAGSNVVVSAGIFMQFVAALHEHVGCGPTRSTSWCGCSGTWTNGLLLELTAALGAARAAQEEGGACREHASGQRRRWMAGTTL